MVIDFLRKYGLIVIGLVVSVVAAFMSGRGVTGMGPVMIIGGGIIALGAAVRAKANKDRG